VKTIDIFYAYINLEQNDMKKKGKSKTCHRKSKEKGEFESLGMSV
jgi:hypothetical protein